MADDHASDRIQALIEERDTLRELIEERATLRAQRDRLLEIAQEMWNVCVPEAWKKLHETHGVANATVEIWRGVLDEVWAALAERGD